MFATEKSFIFNRSNLNLSLIKRHDIFANKTSTSNSLKRSVWHHIFDTLFYTGTLYIYFYSCHSTSCREIQRCLAASREERCDTVPPENEKLAEDRRRCEPVNFTTSTTTATTKMAYRGRLRSLKERTNNKWCKSSSVARMHARCNALATDLEIVSSTPTRWRRSRRVSLCHALFYTRDNWGRDRVNRRISVQSSSTRMHPWNQTTMRRTADRPPVWTIFKSEEKSTLIKM